MCVSVCESLCHATNHAVVFMAFLFFPPLFMPVELQPWPLTAAFHFADKKRRHSAATNNAVKKCTERNCCVLWAIKILFIPPLKQVLARGRHALNKLKSLQHFTPYQHLPMPSDSVDCLLVVFAKASINTSYTQGYGYEQTPNHKKYTLVCHLSDSICAADALNHAAYWDEVCCYFSKQSDLQFLTFFGKA